MRMENTNFQTLYELNSPTLRTPFKFSQQFFEVKQNSKSCMWSCQLCLRKNKLNIDPFQNIPKGWQVIK